MSRASRTPRSARRNRVEPPEASRHPTALPWAVAGCLLVAIAVIYCRAIGFGFLAYDDSAFVLDNPAVRGGLTGQGIVWAFTDGPFGEWYPLAMLSHMLDCTLFGLDARWHHLTSVLLHAATAVGLFLVWWRMTGGLWTSALVAMLFAVHPQRVESVVWIAERRDVLSGLLFVLTLAAYLGYVRHGRSWARYALVALTLALGLLAKPMLVTVPALLLLLDYWPLGRFGRATGVPAANAAIQRPGVLWLVLEKIPLGAAGRRRCVVDAADPCRSGKRRGGLAGAIRQRRGGLRPIHRQARSIRSTWRLFTRCHRPAHRRGKSLGAIAMLGAVSAAVVDRASPVSRICSSAGSGIWE